MSFSRAHLIAVFEHTHSPEGHSYRYQARALDGGPLSSEYASSAWAVWDTLLNHRVPMEELSSIDPSEHREIF